MTRRARASRPQLFCILADNSDSMAGAKAELATEAIRELFLELQTRGPRGPRGEYHRIVLIQWGTEAEFYRGWDMAPARCLNPDDIAVVGNGGKSNMVKALELAHTVLERYLAEVVQSHPERAQHPLPVVVVFSDGWNQGRDPTTMAERIRSLNVDGDSVPLVTVGVEADGSVPANEPLLKSLASVDLYAPVALANILLRPYGGVGLGESEDLSVPPCGDIFSVIKRLEALRERDR